MHLRFSFFQPSSHFSWDTHSKQSFHLVEEGFIWLSFCSFGPWSNSFDLCWTLHALNVISSCILCILHFFICIVSVLILLLLFLLKELTKCKSPNEKRYWVAKAVTHTSIWLGKRESDLYWKCMMPKRQRLVHQIEISKSFRHQSQNEMYWFKIIKCYEL